MEQLINKTIEEFEKKYKYNLEKSEIKSFLISSLTEAYNEGKKESIIEHCDEPECAECNMAAYERGKEEGVEEKFRVVQDMYLDTTHVQGEVQERNARYNAAISDVLVKLNKNK